MPPVSEKQRRAMWAAAEGRSTLGIPKTVGEEFVAADADPSRIAAGTVYVAPDGDVLLLLRSKLELNYGGHWALPGGKADGNETAEEAAERESAEELGNTAPQGQKRLLDKRSTPNGMVFHTFAQSVDEKFSPRLNDEHSGSGWFPLNSLPRPMHPSVRATLGERLGLGMAEDMEAEDWEALRQNFAQWARQGGNGQAEDQAAMATTGNSGAPIAGKRKPLAFSVDSVPPMGEDGVHAACDGRGCKTCGWTGVANTNYWPMKPSTGAMDSLRAIAAAWSGAADEWNEGDHPRGQPGNAGQFGSAGGSTKSPHEGKKGSFSVHSQASLPKQGFKPKKRGAGNNVTEAVQVAWGHAQATGKSQTLFPSTGKNSYVFLKPGSDMTHGMPHIVVDPDGTVTQFKPSWAGKSTSDSDGSTTEKPASTSKSPIKMGDLSKKGGKLGTNEGGLYEHTNGSKFYIKKPATKAHVENERMAAKLYNLAGSKTLDYRDVEGGEHVATEWKQLEKKNISEFTPTERKEAAKDFAVHAWLSNWDAAGTGGDNQGILGGKTTTLDVGGSLRFRAMGGPKGQAFGDKVSEWDTMRNKGMSPDAAKLFAPMTESELKESVERVTKIPDAKIREAVGKDTELANRLIARKKDLASRVGIAMDALSPTIAAWLNVPSPEFLAFDRAMLMSVSRPGIAFAFDRKRAGSVRDFDADGRLHVEISNISKAIVNPYLGKEIPKYKELGLEPDRIYQLLRCPIELELAAASFNNLPLLDEHVPVSAASHRPEHVIGSTGTDASFENPHLKNSLVIWADRGIKAIESEKKKELSSAYRYRADMTPGVFDGVQYDGVMRDIIGNHVALVEEGRAGSDVVVGDSQNPTITRRTATMKKAILTHRASVARGALMVFLQPQLGMDAKINLSPVLNGVTAANFKKKRPAITSAIHTMLGDLAQDGSIKAGLDAVLDMIEGMPKAEDADLEFKDGDPAEDADMDDDGAEDEGETDEEKAAREAKEKAAKDKKAKDAKKAKDKKPAAMDADVNEDPEDNETGAEDEENKKAMDAAIQAGISAGIKEERKRIEAITAAKEHVRGRVGNLSMAFDSAGDVFRQALKIATGKEAPKTADTDTLRFAFDNLPSAVRSDNRTTIAMDSTSTAKTLADRSPALAKNLSRIGRA